DRDALGSVQATEQHPARSPISDGPPPVTTSLTDGQVARGHQRRSPRADGPPLRAPRRWPPLVVRRRWPPATMPPPPWRAAGSSSAPRSTASAFEEVPSPTPSESPRRGEARRKGLGLGGE